MQRLPLMVLGPEALLPRSPPTPQTGACPPLLPARTWHSAWLQGRISQRQQVHKRLLLPTSPFRLYPRSLRPARTYTASCER